MEGNGNKIEIKLHKEGIYYKRKCCGAKQKSYLL